MKYVLIVLIAAIAITSNNDVFSKTFKGSLVIKVKNDINKLKRYTKIKILNTASPLKISCLQ